MSARPRVELLVSGGVAEIVLSSPETRNAIDPEWVVALAQAVAGCAERPGIRAVAIRALGPAFTVGGDLAHFGAAPDRLAEELDRMVRPYHVALARLADLPVPVVCGARGAIAGGGLGLLWAADVVVLGEDARLIGGGPTLGLSGDGGSSWYLPRLIGLGRAAALMMGGRVLDAAEALAWGIAAEVVAVDALPGRVTAVARGYAAGPTRAYGEMRRLLRSSFARDLPGALDAEREAQVRCGSTADAREGIRAFAERRPPRFSGR
jgi:2-(1,2-epoxy-1,2-dihydrophenyl)acetyl-CoA isomerase